MTLFSLLDTSTVKKSIKLLFLISFIVFFTISCGPDFPTIEGLDYQAWIHDQSGCKGEREKMITLVHENKEQFLYFNQHQIISMFGKPENQTLYTRSQTIYYYHIKNSSHCSSNKENKNDDETMMLQIRFDALNRSKEVFVFNYNV